MSNYAAITGSSKIVHRNQGGGSKLQGIPSSTNLNTWAHVAFRNRNVVCPCKRDIIFCMNQLGGVGAGGIPGRSYAFAPTADGTHKPFYCGHRFNYYLGNNKHLIIPKKHLGEYTLLYNNPPFEYLYMQNLNSTNQSNMMFDNSSIKLITNKTYYIFFLDPNVHIVFKVTKSYPNNSYSIDIISEKNFDNYSTINYIGSQNLLEYKNSSYKNPKIKLYIRN